MAGFKRAMIAGDPPLAAQPTDNGRFTLDDLFRRAARRRPDALALIDPANRDTFTDHAPRRLTYAEADRVASAIAARLHGMGLLEETVIGIQLPNTVESVLTFLGVLRAGMIAAPLPLLWRRAEAVSALKRVGAKALITYGRVGAFDHAELALKVGADVFGLRYVCAYGATLPDGVVGFDDLCAAGPPAPVAPPGSVVPVGPRDAISSSGRIAVITADTGGRPIARNPRGLFAAGLSVLLEGGIRPDAIILSAIAPSSFAGISLTILPWLVSGGTLVLHHALDLDVLAQQWSEQACDTLILPEQVVFALAEAGALADRSVTAHAVWRAPEHLAESRSWSAEGAALVDVAVFGETALRAARRGADGRPAALVCGAIVAPDGGPSTVQIAEMACTEAGTVAFRGAMVPPLPPVSERGASPGPAPGEFVDTGYPCRIDRNGHSMVVTGPPAGVVGVGGYRFLMRDLQDIVERIDNGARLAVLPDPVLGQRLVGSARNRTAVAAALSECGANPLLIAAFSDRPRATGRPR